MRPKPPSATEQNGKAIRLASRQGSERFGPTSGFDTLADLANYAEPIAITSPSAKTTSAVFWPHPIGLSRAFSTATNRASS